MIHVSARAEMARVRSGALSVREAVATRLELLHAADDLTHAIAWFEDEAVLREADRLDADFARNRDGVGPLHGLPITVKDWIDVAGFPCAGERDDRHRRPSIDATVVRRLRAAGAIVVAKTKAWGPEAPADGCVRHPTHHDRLPGGSSTGEAVAVAAGASIVGVGSDSGGSIRVPAAWCGVVGFKPTAGLLPLTGHYPRVGERHDGRTQIGPLARSVDDAALLLAVMAAPDGLDMSVPPVVLPWEETMALAGLTFAVIGGADELVTVDGEVDATVESAASILEAAGLQRVEWTAPWLADGLDLTRRYWSRWDQSGAEVDRQLWEWDTFRFRYRRASAQVDLLLTATTPTTAPTRGRIEDHHWLFTAPASLTGSPAMALPWGAAADGLPLSVQLIGRPWEDHRVLAVARVLERQREALA